MSTPASVETLLAEVLAEHAIECTGRGEVTCRGCRNQGWMSWHTYRAHVAAEQAAVLAQYIDGLLREARGEVDSQHHFHGDDCLCGFSSARSRSRTEHITGALAAALGGDE